jgi:hypothetical protein
LGERRKEMKRITLVLIVPMVLGLGCIREKGGDLSKIIFMIGEVTKNNAAVQIGDPVHERDVIRTGADSFCDIKIGESLIRVKQNTRVLMSSLVRKGAAENISIDLGVGKLLCKPKKLLKSESFLIKTPTAIAGVRGTQFTVEADANSTSRIKVFEGHVKVAKRIRYLDPSISEVLKMAPEVNKDEKVIITKPEVEKTEKLVDWILDSEPAKSDEAAVRLVLKRAGGDIVAGKEDIKKFSVADYAKDNREIIAVKEKPVEVIRQIKKVIKIEKEAPKPQGRILITRYEVFFIKNGKVEWEGKVVEDPVKSNDRLYIASGDYVFCASVDGPVLWRKKLENEGRIRIVENKLVVETKGEEIRLDLNTGDRR